MDGLRRIQHKSLFSLAFYREDYREAIRGYKQRLLLSIAMFQVMFLTEPILASVNLISFMIRSIMGSICD